jgi:hypothetical protein
LFILTILLILSKITSDFDRIYRIDMIKMRSEMERLIKLATRLAPSKSTRDWFIGIVIVGTYVLGYLLLSNQTRYAGQSFRVVNIRTFPNEIFVAAYWPMGQLESRVRCEYTVLWDDSGETALSFVSPAAKIPRPARR